MTHSRPQISPLCWAITEMITGLIVDYATISKMCTKCNQHTALDKKVIREEEHKKWKDNHSASCDLNYEDTSGGMEAAAAIKLWNRSLQHYMRYMHFV